VAGAKQVQACEKERQEISNAESLPFLCVGTFYGAFAERK
jgi:hypothetical protein